MERYNESKAIALVANETDAGQSGVFSDAALERLVAGRPAFPLVGARERYAVCPTASQDMEEPLGLPLTMGG